MAANMAMKRAKKAQRRKLVVAQKRQAGAFESSIAGQAISAAKMPIQHCLLTGSLTGCGMATLVLTRGSTPDHVTMAVFLLDSFGLGIKDVLFESVTGEQLAFYLNRAKEAGPVEALEPGQARKLLHDLVAWSRSLGFSPHRDYAAVERMFGDVVADAEGVPFQFGLEGKPMLVSGPSDAPEILRRLGNQLEMTSSKEGAFEIVDADDPPSEGSARAA